MTEITHSDDLFQFPCDFPIKILGRCVPELAQTIVAAILQYAPDYDPLTTEMRTSNQGTYLSLTCTIRAHSRDQLNQLYSVLSQHPLVTMVL